MLTYSNKQIVRHCHFVECHGTKLLNLITTTAITKKMRGWSHFISVRQHHNATDKCMTHLCSFPPLFRTCIYYVKTPKPLTDAVRHKSSPIV
mmetsp:Transcript_35668/g.41296  ORF Transcript_35668/g.41296 Transcript_35668/m.41296 type:complete len:92 (+) Transcript_35668:1088-1363(+)